MSCLGQGKSRLRSPVLCNNKAKVWGESPPRSGVTFTFSIFRLDLRNLRKPRGCYRVLPLPESQTSWAAPPGKNRGKVGTVARSQPQAAYPTKFRHLVHQLLETLLLSLHLDEMLQLRVHRAQTRRGRRRRGIHPSAATLAKTNSVPTHRPSRVSATEPEPQPDCLWARPVSALRWRAVLSVAPPAAPPSRLCARLPPATPLRRFRWTLRPHGFAAQCRGAEKKLSEERGKKPNITWPVSAGPTAPPLPTSKLARAFRVTVLVLPRPRHLAHLLAVLGFQFSLRVYSHLTEEKETPKEIVSNLR